MNNKNISNIQADLLLLIVSFIWGSGFVVTKTALDSLSPMYIMFFRFAIASILAIIIFGKHLKTATKSDIKAGFFMGVFLSLGFALQTIGLQFTSVGKQAFLTGTNVVMVPFVYMILTKKKPKKNNVIAAILTFVGIGLLTLNFENNVMLNKGDLYTLSCALFFALHIVTTGYFSSDKNPFVINTIQLISSTIFFLIAVFFVDGFKTSLSTSAILTVSYLGVLSTFLAFSLQTFAQKYTSSTHAAIILSLESVFGSALGVIILGEFFTPLMIIGCVVIFIGIITAETGWKFNQIERN